MMACALAWLRRVCLLSRGDTFSPFSFESLYVVRTCVDALFRRDPAAKRNRLAMAMEEEAIDVSHFRYDTYERMFKRFERRKRRLEETFLSL